MARTKEIADNSFTIPGPLQFEDLENRVLPSVSVVLDTGVSPQTASFTSDNINDNLYLQTSDGALQYGTTNGSFVNAGISLNAATTIDVNIGGTLYLENFAATGAYNLTIDASSNAAPIQIQGNISTLGGNLSISGSVGIEVAPTSVISTRPLSNSVPAGSLTITTQNADQFNPLPAIELDGTSDFPQITVDGGARLLANASGGNGAITLTATNINYTLDGLTFPTLQAMARTANITFADSTTSAKTLVLGGTIEIEATAGDISLQNEVSNNNGPAAGPWLGGAINSALSAVNALPGINLLTLPAAISYKDSVDDVTIGQNTQIVGSGDVTVQADASADATGQAMYQLNPTLGAAVAVMYGATDAETDVQSGALIESTGGSISINSSASTTANATASPAAKKSTNIPKAQFSFAVGISQQTALTTIEQGATLAALDNIDLETNNGTNNTGSVTTTAYTSTNNTGQFAGAIAVNVSISNIETNVNGTLLAEAASDPEDTAPTVLTLNPFTQIDFANSALIVPSSQFSDYSTGQQISYNNGGGGNIDGLQSGDTYFVIVPTSGVPTDEIRLAATFDNANGGYTDPVRPIPDALRPGERTNCHRPHHHH